MTNPHFITHEQSQELVRLGVLNISMFKYNKQGELVAPFTNFVNAPELNFAPWWSDGRHLPAFQVCELLELFVNFKLYGTVSAKKLIDKLGTHDGFLESCNDYLLAKLPESQRELILAELSK